MKCIHEFIVTSAVSSRYVDKKCEWSISLDMTANNASPLVTDETRGTVLITIKMLLVPLKVVFLSNVSFSSRKLFIQITRQSFSYTWRSHFKLIEKMRNNCYKIILYKIRDILPSVCMNFSTSDKTWGHHDIKIVYFA